MHWQEYAVGFRRFHYFASIIKVVMILLIPVVFILMLVVNALDVAKITKVKKGKVIKETLLHAEVLIFVLIYIALFVLEIYFMKVVKSFYKIT